MSVAALALILALQAVGLFLGGASIAACSESVPLAPTEESACETVTSSISLWLLAVTWPPLGFGASQLVPWARAHSLGLAVVTTVLFAVFWTYVLGTA